MLYLLDNNVLSDANRDYYPMTRVPEFWEWLLHQGVRGHIKIPLEIYEEIKEGRGDLVTWAKQDAVSEALLLEEQVDVSLVARVTDEGYASDLTDSEVEKMGRDPFLIAYAVAELGERCVVTTEASKPKKQRANRHVPDVCRDFAVPCCDTFELIRVLGFSTQWKLVE